AGARAAADNYVRARQDARLDEAKQALAAAAEADQVLHVQRAAHELADVQQRAVDGDRWYRDVDARTVAEPGVGKRRCDVNAPADRLDDVADDCHQLLFGLEPDRRHQDLAVDLDVDIVRAHDHDLGDEGLLHEL